MSCNTMGANHVTYKRVRLVQEVQEPEERVHVEVEGDDDVVRLFRPQGQGRRIMGFEGARAPPEHTSAPSHRQKHPLEIT